MSGVWSPIRASSPPGARNRSGFSELGDNELLISSSSSRSGQPIEALGNAWLQIRRKYGFQIELAPLLEPEIAKKTMAKMRKNKKAMPSISQAS